jgi:hypothetical protein
MIHLPLVRKQVEDTGSTRQGVAAVVARLGFRASN